MYIYIYAAFPRSFALHIIPHPNFNAMVFHLQKFKCKIMYV